MKFWNKTLRDMDEYIPGEQPANIDEYIKLNTNENPFPPSEKVMKAITEHVDGNLRRYPDSKAKKVRELFAEQNNISPDNVFVGNGSDEIFTLIFRGLIEDDGIAAFPYPSYSLYDTLAQGNGIKYEKINLTDDLQIDLNKFLVNKYDMVIISNPNNPTGTYVSTGKIKEFLNIYKGLMIVDEAYIDFYGGSSLGLVNEYDNLIVTRSFSKSYSLAGLRVGLAIANPDIINGLMKIKDSYNVDMLALAGAEAALLDTRTFEYNLRMLRNNKEYLEERLTDMNFTIIPSKANFIFTKHPEISAGELYEKLKEEKILVRHFKGEIQSDYLRITIGSMMEIKRLCSAIESITGGGE
ncbi:MAG TPA: histidinol-phosphate transaminase [Spirochaetota bacterium]|nr:histidinol-phosphate transaminase [Spirochaetota bacterium]